MFQLGMAETTAELLHSFGNGLNAIRFYFDSLQETRQTLLTLADHLETEKRAGETTISPEQLSTVLRDLVGDHLGPLLESTQGTLAQLIEQLQLHRDETPEGTQHRHRRFDLPFTIRHVVAAFNERLHHSQTKLQLNLDPSLQQIQLPLGPFRRMLTALLKNAIEAIEMRREKSTFSPQIEISTRRTTPWEDHPGEFELAIKDNGEGLPVPPDQTDQLFARHFSTRYPGGGQGLHYVGNFVVRLGGTISAAPLSPTGAHFRLTLPLLLTPEEKRCYSPQACSKQQAGPT